MSCALALAAACVNAAEFSHWLSVSFDGYDGSETLADFPALVKLSNAIEGFDYSEFRQENGGDLRFFDANGTLLAHEIDTWDTNGVSTVWVKVPSFNAQTAITAKYGSVNPPDALAASNVWANGYVGVWHLNEDSSPLADATGGGMSWTRPAGHENMVSLGTAGILGNAPEFAMLAEPSGSEIVHHGHLTFKDNGNKFIGQAMTFEMWTYQREDRATNRRLLYKKDKDLAFDFNLQYSSKNSQSTLTFNFVATNMLDNVSLVTNAVRVRYKEEGIGVWRHYTTVYDSVDTHRLLAYVNGANSGSSDDSVAVSPGYSIVPSGGTMYLGNLSSKRAFPGRIDEVRISNVARSPAWVKATHDTVKKDGFATYVLDEKTYGVFGTATNAYAEIEKKGASALAIRGDTLFCGAGDLLYVLDISNPLAPRYVSKLAGFSQLRQIAVEGDLLGISSRGGGAWLVDVSDLAAPRILSHIDTVEQATGMEIAGNFMAIGQRSTGVELLDITDRTKPQHICLVKTQESQSCRYQNGILYSGDWHSGRVNLIDVTDISKASIIGTTLMHGYGDGFDIDGDYIYASTGHHRIRGEVSGSNDPANYGMGHGIEIWNRSNPSNVTFVSRVEFPMFYRQGNDWWQCCESEGWVFCCDTHNGVFVVDARNPANPYVSDRFVDFNPKDPDAPSRCINSIAVGNGAVYATSGGGLWVIPCEYARYRAEDRGTELTQENLAWRDSYETPSSSHFTAWIPDERGPVHSAAAYGGCYYAGCSYAGAYVIDARTLKTLRRIPCAYARDVYVRDGKLYIAQGDEGLGIYSLEDPANPVEERRITQLTDKLSHFEWVYVPTPRWAVCHARRNSGKWYFIDLSKDPAETVSYVMSTNLSTKVSGASGMDWVRPFSDGLVRGKWLGYARTHGFFMWFDMSGDTPVCYDTTDTTSTIVNSSSRPNYIGTSSCCTPISEEKVLVSNGKFFILDPDLDRWPRVEKWPTFGYANCSDPNPDGMSSWDGKTHVGLAAQQGRRIQMVEISDPERPILEWYESTKGCPENGVFDANGLFLVPCGYQGLLVQKRFEPEVPVPAPSSFAHSFNVGFAGYAGGETLTDFPALVRLSSAIDGFSYSDFAFPENGGDLRFFDAKGNLLSHEIDTWNTNGESMVWVKVPSLNAATVIKAAYGCSAPPANDPKDVWSNGFVGVWHMGEATLPMKDSVNGGTSLTENQTGATLPGQPGLAGNAIAFDQLSTHKGCLQTMDQRYKTSGRTDYTVEFWSYQDSCEPTNLPRSVYYMREVGSTTIWQAYGIQSTTYGSNGKTVVQVRLADGTTQNPSTGNSYPLKGNWTYQNFRVSDTTHYYQGLNRNPTIYSANYPGGVTNDTANTTLSIGNSSSGSQNAFPGMIDEVRISSVARSDDWMRATYDTMMSGDFSICLSEAASLPKDYAEWSEKMGIPGEPEQKHNGIAKGIRYAFDITPEKGPDEIGDSVIRVVQDSDGHPVIQARALAEGRDDVEFGVLATENLNDWSEATLVPMKKFDPDGFWKPAQSESPGYVFPDKMFYRYFIDVR